MSDLPGGASGLLVRDYKGKEADRLVTRIDPGVISLVADLRGDQRQAAEELEQWKTRAEELGDLQAPVWFARGLAEFQETRPSLEVIARGVPKTECFWARRSRR